MKIKIFGFEIEFNLRRATEDSNFVRHARRELDLAGFFDEDSDYDGAIGPAVMDLVHLLDKDNHSGTSARLTAGLFATLVDFGVLTPLTGEDDEWSGVSGLHGLVQNKRYSRVFKESDGMAYDITGIVFVDEIGPYTNSDSRVPVTFPYTPKTEIRHVTHSEGG